MGFNGVLSMGAVVLAFFIGLASSSFISDEVFSSHGSTGRTLLQSKQNCPVSFEYMNYTIITSQCKGPDYPAKQCCGALVQFACPYADDLNDATNDCASTMFSYINLYGKYPPGLFASECTGNKEGLPCNGTNSTAQADSSGSIRNPNFGELGKIVFGLIGVFAFLVLVV
ncbi:hypothetical protein LUZ60_003299 [Juncus effusus]|nr:hypothetical protein LUZ60_003299 [Juncus effusus]